MSVIIGKGLIFLLPLALILNTVALSNSRKFGFYGIFPLGGSGTISRNALISTIDGNESVSEQNNPVLRVFMQASEQYHETNPLPRKGSLAKHYSKELASDLYSGFEIYNIAHPDLCKHFAIDIEKAEPQLSKMLKPFYKEIRHNNKSHLWMLRALSFLNSFRSSTGLVDADNRDINLGRLPEWIIVLYKIVVFLFSVFVFLGSVVYVIFKVVRKQKPLEIVSISILLYIGILFTNFFFANVGDSNRFKFPAEPFIIFLGIYYLNELYLWTNSVVNQKK